jgi:Fe-S cluster biogenesis protein NfuA
VKSDDDALPAKLRRLEQLVQQAEQFPDPAARAHAREIVRALLDLHGVGLKRLLEHVTAADEAGSAILDACAADEVVGGLLLLHGLHPLDVDDRVRQALEQSQVFLDSHGVNVEFLGIEDGVVRLQLDGGCDCPSSAAAIRQAVEEAIYARAPEIVAVAIDGLDELTASEAGRFALPVL